MIEDDIKAMLWNKELALVDFGSVKLVKPTGRYVDTAAAIKDEYYITAHRWLVEVEMGFALQKKWVSFSQLKEIKMAGGKQ